MRSRCTFGLMKDSPSRPATRLTLMYPISLMRIRVQQTRATDRAKAPDVAQQLLFGEDARRLRRKLHHQLVLLRRERHRPAMDGDAPRAAVDRERAGRQALAQAGLRPSQHGMDAGDELLVVEGPRDEVVAAALEGMDAVDGIGGARSSEDDHRHVTVPGPPGLTGPQHATHLKRRRIRQAADQHEVGALALDQFERFATGVSSEHREAVAREVPREELTRSRLGLREEQRLRHETTLSPAPRPRQMSFRAARTRPRKKAGSLPLARSETTPRPHRERI